MDHASDADPANASDGIFIRSVDALTEFIVVVSLIGQVALVLLHVGARVFFDASFLWTEEVSHISLSVLAFVGGALAYRRGYHSAVAIFLNMFPAWLRKNCLVTADLLVFMLSLCLLALSGVLIQQDWIRETPFLEIPFAVFAIPFSVSMVLFPIFAVTRLKGANVASLMFAVAVLAAMVVLGAATQYDLVFLFSSKHALLICLSTLFILVFLGLPIAFALTASSFIYFWLTNSVPMVAIPQRMVGNIGGFILLSIPFFIFAGLIMERGGLSLRLVEFGQALVGHIRGGLHQVVVVSMYLCSGLSGSDSADVAAVGTVMRNMPESKQYPHEEGAAVLAASAVMGSTVPPSIAMLVLGSITQISIAGLFIGGVLPAAAIAICLMLLIYWKARRADLPRLERASSARMLHATRGAVLPMTMPIILFGGILTGVATPTEVSSFAVIYGILIAMGVYRFMNWRGLVRATIDSALLSGLILYILAAASIFSWALTIGYLPQRLVELIQSMGGESSTIFMLGSIALLIVTGSLLEGLPALNILAPMLVPIATKFGIDQLHYGMVLLISMGVGIFAPPAGVGFYVACGIMRTKIESTARAMIPYLIVIIIGLLIVAFVPWITLSLPRAFGIGS
jgi:tripartite ATP-independent transporter DctM subunit